MDQTGSPDQQAAVVLAVHLGFDPEISIPEGQDIVKLISKAPILVLLACLYLVIKHLQVFGAHFQNVWFKTMNNTVAKLKTSTEGGFNSRLNQVEGRISKHQGTALEFIRSEEREEKKMSEDSARTYRTGSSGCITVGVPEGGEGKGQIFNSK